MLGHGYFYAGFARERKPHQLSGGQRQRVAWRAAGETRPKLLLLDEPMGALDEIARPDAAEVVDIALERVGVTCVMVTHDRRSVTMAGRIAIMNRGKFVQIGEPEEIYGKHPTTRYSARYRIGKCF